METPLTRRQTECIELVRQGLTSKQIGHKLGISSRTVDQHVGDAMELLQVNNRIAAVTKLQEMRDDHLSKAKRRVPANDTIDTKPDGGIKTSAEVGASPSTPRKFKVLPRMGGVENIASTRQRIVWMVRIMVFSIMLSCTVILTILGVLELARRLDS